jgi:hypothetical protein
MRANTIPTKDWQWFGQAGHFCSADNCRFHLHTHVGDYCVSTVGEWFPADGEKMHAIGGAGHDERGGRTYETMVFTIDGGRVSSTEISCDAYWSRKDANDGHLAMCEKYAAIAPVIAPASLAAHETGEI